MDPLPTKRGKMSLVCLDELFSLVSAHDEAAAGPMILVQPPTPRLLAVRLFIPPRKMESQKRICMLQRLHTHCTFVWPEPRHRT